jgi:hypothetical protein
MEGRCIEQSCLERKEIDDNELPPHKIYVGSEAEELTKANENKIQVPPKPDGILPWNDEEKKMYVFPRDTLDEKDKFIRTKFKLFNLWVLWGHFRNNKKIADMVNNIPQDKKSDEYYLKEAIVALIDNMGKALNANTDILEEFS